MKERIKIGEIEPRIYKAMNAAEKQLSWSRSKNGVSDDTYQTAVEQFGKQKTAQLIFLAITTSSWNQIAISAHLVAEQD